VNYLVYGLYSIILSLKSFIGYIIFRIYWRALVPVATITSDTERFDLKTLPEAYVVVRRMTYGESLKRTGMMTKFLVGGNPTNRDFSGEVEMNQEEVTLWDFANCVVEHNLTDENGKLLNFKNQVDVRRLDIRVGEEIGRYIDEVNNFEEKPEIKNS